MSWSGAMRAVVVEQPGDAGALHMGELPDPSPLGAQVLVEIEAAGVNPVDAGNRADPAWAGLTPPYVVGYEFAGTVVAGDGAGLRSGDAVWGLLPVRGTRWGAYAERIAVDAAYVAPRPAALDVVQAAVLPLAGGTALQVLDRLDPARSVAPGSRRWVRRPAGVPGSRRWAWRPARRPAVVS